jgi:predicted alpha/beta superfamily hydrolase
MSLQTYTMGAFIKAWNTLDCCNLENKPMQSGQEMSEKLHIRKIGDGGPVIYWGMFPDEEGQTEQLAEQVLKLKPEAAFTLAAYEVSDWNRDFSPWKSIAGDRIFEGCAEQTADTLTRQIIPEVHRQIPDFTREYVIGYSLAGLFSLWVFYEKGIFQGAASCSGSLWFEGWQDYAGKAETPEGSCVYLSLGGKEEKTSDPVMSSIGNMTRWQAEQLKQDKNILAHKLEWNSGGHFADPVKRLAKGIVWLLEQN